MSDERNKRIHVSDTTAGYLEVYAKANKLKTVSDALEKIVQEYVKPWYDSRGR